MAINVDAHELRERLGPVPAGFPEDLFDTQIHCYLCGVTCTPPADVAGFSYVCKINGTYVFTKRAFSVYQCDKCGTGVTFPQVARRYIPLLYENHDSISFLDEVGLVNQVRRFFFRWEARWWLKWLGKTGGLSRFALRVLDFGTGSGMNAIAFANVLGDRGRVWAADFQTDPPSRLLGNTHVSYLSQRSLEESGELFDCIHMRHMLEHAPNPLSFLLRMRELLSAGGSLFIEVPSLYPALHPFTMRHFPDLFQSNLPYHCCFFTPESLCALLSRAGFSPEFQKTDIPVVGRMMQARTGRLFAGQRYLPLFVLGVLLYPMQWLYVRLNGIQPMIRVLARKTDEAVVPDKPVRSREAKE